MKMDKIEDVIYYITLGILCLLLIIMGFFWDKEIKERIVIKDPLLITEDMQIVRPEIQGLYGVISEKDLKKFLNYKNTFELMENKR